MADFAKDGPKKPSNNAHDWASASNKQNDDRFDDQELERFYVQFMGDHDQGEDYSLIEAELAAFDAKIASGEVTLDQPTTAPLLFVARVWRVELIRFCKELENRFPDIADPIAQVKRVFSLTERVGPPFEVNEILQTVHSRIKPRKQLPETEERLATSIRDIAAVYGSRGHRDLAQLLEAQADRIWQPTDHVSFFLSENRN